MKTCRFCRTLRRRPLLRYVGEGYADVWACRDEVGCARRTAERHDRHAMARRLGVVLGARLP